MKYMTMVFSEEDQGPPPPALMQAIMQLGMEAAKAGVLVQQGGLQRTSAGGLRVRVAGGRLSVMDGPFAESKEVVGGFAVYSVGSREEIIEWTKRFMQIHIDHWPGWSGVSEVRQIYEAPGAP